MQFDTSEVKNKRFRASNFTEHEKNLLLGLVFKHKNIVENKKTDSTAIHEKRQTWEIIAKEFNSASPGLIPRSSDPLKKCYDNRKKELRKEIAKERCELYKTGGGPPPPPPKKPVDDLLLSIINKKTIFGLENPFDGDSLNLDSQTSINSQMPQTTRNNPVSMPDSSRSNRPLALQTNTTLEVKTGRSIFDLKKGNLLTNDEGNDDNNNILVCGAHNKDASIPPSDFIEFELNAPQQHEENPQNNGREKQLPRARRRPATVVKALSSSNIAEEYDKLLDQRLLLCNYEMAKLKSTMRNNEIEHKLRVEALHLDIKIKKRQLESLEEM